MTGSGGAVKLVVLGAPRPVTTNRWKDDLAEAANLLDWDVTHLPAQGIPAEDVVRESKSADLLIWARTHGHIPTGDVAGMLRRIEAAGTTTVGLHLDLYWDVRHRQRTIGRDPWWTCQHVFTADGGPRPWAETGINHHWLPPPMGHRFYGRGVPDIRFMAQCAFIGSDIPRIHGPHRRKLINWAVRRYGSGFVRHGGPGPQVWGQALNDACASTRVIVGDSAPAPYYWSDRIPTILGRGGLLAHPHTPGLTDQGFTAETMVLFNRYDFADLDQQLDALTATDRDQITDNALTLIGERHMWSHRLLDIQRVVFG